MRLELGKGVRCADGASRELADVVIDGTTNAVTHLVVQPHDDHDAARLVPIQLAAAGGNGHEVSLTVTSEVLKELEPVAAHAYLRPGERVEQESNWDIGVEDVETVPQYTPTAFGEFGEYAQDAVVTYDRVPKGEIELRHASAVYSADRHHLGSVDGVVVDSDHRITHLLLERGHLWWKRELAIPAEAISKFETDMVVLGIEKSELGAAVSKG
jgi:sporulation protein YlmC with PRC-barrel domain